MSIRDVLTGTTQPGSSRPAGLSVPRLGRVLHSASLVEWELWLAATAFMLADVTLTFHGLLLGLAEANPIARGALDHFGALGLYGLKLGALGIGAVCRLAMPDRYGALVPVGLAIPSGIAALMNATLITLVSL